jgi:flagellar biogenesis protein FliO
MQEWVQNIIGDTVNPIVAYIGIFLLIILAIYILVRIARRLLGGTFVSGGKSRQMRLAVMDATPVDSHRRLVLVRRDDVEHLILIGGPTDVVVEQNIKLSAQPHARMEPAATQSMPAAQRLDTPAPVPLRPVQPAVQPAPATPRQFTPTPVAPRPSPQPAPPAPVRSLSPVATSLEPRPVAAPMPEMTSVRPIAPLSPKGDAPAVGAAAAMGAQSATTSPSAPKPPVAEEDAMLVDLSNDIDKAANNDADEITLEDEMEGLLASLDTKKDRIG